MNVTGSNIQPHNNEAQVCKGLRLILISTYTVFDKKNLSIH